MPGRVARNHGRKALLGVVAALALTSVPAVAQQPPGAPSPAVSPPAGTLPGGGGSADLRIDLDVDHRGSDLEDDGSARFDATVVNNGPGVARDVQVVVSTPKEFNLNEVNHEAECEHNPGDEGRMVCRYGDLAPGAELRLRFRGDFHGDGRSWTHVFVRSASMDPDPGNNHAREEVTVEKEESQDDDFDGDRVTGEFTLRDPDEPVHSADAVEPPSVGGDFEIDARSGPNGEDARGRYSVRIHSPNAR